MPSVLGNDFKAIVNISKYTPSVIQDIDRKIEDVEVLILIFGVK